MAYPTVLGLAVPIRLDFDGCLVGPCLQVRALREHPRGAGVGKHLRFGDVAAGRGQEDLCAGSKCHAIVSVLGVYIACFCCLKIGYLAQVTGDATSGAAGMSYDSVWCLDCPSVIHCGLDLIRLVIPDIV